MLTLLILLDRLDIEKTLSSYLNSIFQIYFSLNSFYNFFQLFNYISHQFLLNYIKKI